MKKEERKYSPVINVLLVVCLLAIIASITILFIFTKENVSSVQNLVVGFSIFVLVFSLYGEFCLLVYRKYKLEENEPMTKEELDRFEREYKEFQLFIAARKAEEERKKAAKAKRPKIK